MDENMLVGILLVTAAGVGTGTLAWPMKLMRTLAFEHYWFVAMLIGLILIPWAVVWFTIPDFLGAYAEVGWKPLVLANAISICWGTANVLFGVCVIRIGAALTGAILSGVAVAAGVTLPMIVKGSGQFSQSPDLTSVAGLAVLAGIAVMLVGVVLSAVAGFGRDRAIGSSGDRTRPASGGFLGGLIMSVIAGVTSTGISLSFVYAQDPIVKAMEIRKVGPISTNVAVWAAVLLGGACVNLGYPAWLMTKKRSWAMLGRSLPDLALAAALGIQIIVSIVLLGRGMLYLGTLGASVGFGIQQTTQVLGNQAVGFLSGEWRGIGGRPLRQMVAAVAILILAVAILAYAKKLSGA